MTANMVADGQPNPLKLMASGVLPVGDAIVGIFVDPASGDMEGDQPSSCRFLTLLTNHIPLGGNGELTIHASGDLRFNNCGMVCDIQSHGRRGTMTQVRDEKQVPDDLRHAFVDYANRERCSCVSPL